MPKAARYALIWSSERGVYELYEQSHSLAPLLWADDEAWYVWLASTSSAERMSGGVLLLMAPDSCGAHQHSGRSPWVAAVAGICSGIHKRVGCYNWSLMDIFIG